MKVEEAFQKVTDEGISKKSAEVRRIRDIAVGKIVRQGDIYAHRVNGTHPMGEALQTRQLAVGVTQGSRHMAESKPTVKIYAGKKLPEWCAEGTFLGPVIVATERFTITHPEHAHIELPAGCFQITHQMDARTLDRVRD